MSLLHTLELSIFGDHVRSTAVVVDEVMHTVPLETILGCPRASRLSRMILNYCSLKDESPEEAFNIFAKRSGQLFPHILHYANTGHLIYPVAIELTKVLVSDLCHYGLIKIRDGYCYQCLMEYFKMHCSEDSENDDQRKDSFLSFVPETVIIRTQVIKSEMYIIRAWGVHSVLEKLFPKCKRENDGKFFQLNMSVSHVYTDLCEFLKQTADIICRVVRKLGFRVTCFSTWSDDARLVTTGQWILFRQVPADINTKLAKMEKPTIFKSKSTTVRPRNRRIVQLFRRKEALAIPMEYPEIPSSTSHDLKTETDPV